MSVRQACFRGIWNELMKDFQLLKKAREYIKKLGLFVIPLALFILAGIFFVVSQILNWQMQALSITDNPFPEFHPAGYPLVERTYTPEVSAYAAYVVETISRVPVFAKNENIRFSPASTTKIMTALVALDYYKLSDVLTVKRDFVEGSGLH